MVPVTASSANSHSRDETLSIAAQRAVLPLRCDSHRVDLQFGEEGFKGAFGLTIGLPRSDGALGNDDLVAVTIKAPVEAMRDCAEALEKLFLGRETLVPPFAGRTVELTYTPEGPIPSAQRLATMIGVVYRSMLSNTDV